MNYLQPLPRAMDWQDKLVLLGCTAASLTLLGLALFGALA